MPPSLEAFIARWAASGDAERANKDSFLNELADVLEVERPHPKTGDPARDVFVFEKTVPKAVDGGVSKGHVDLYKQGCFLLEAKQAGETGPKRRGSPAWNQLMSEAHGQALGYAAHLDAPPPFLVVCDIGYCFDFYSAFDGSGAYRPFPDGQRKRIFFADLARHVDLLRAVWTDPLSLDPSRRSAAVTRDVAARIAELARDLEAASHPPEAVATFLMRCLFTMFAEDVGLLSDRPFSTFLESYWLASPASFPSGVASLWRAMDRGGDFVTGRLLRFNGGLFAHHEGLPLTRDQLALLLAAAKSDWSQVDPSIFGTLLERALNPKERHRLGAHYTPRAYVERLVRPTIEEPLRADWDLVRAEVRELVEAGKVTAAQERVLDFHHQLCRMRVLDPACGTGNFLNVTLDLFKRLESEILALLDELGYQQISLEMERFRVTPEQFLGIEVKRWAKEIAELVLWIGYLQWQVRQPGGALTVPQPVLHDYGNIECRDAVLTWDREELLTDEAGKPVTRWDGETMKLSPVTGQEVPDDAAQVPIYRYVNTRRSTWPQAHFIIGNPPYIGNKRMRLALGDGYVEALRKAHDDVPETADYVMYWWNQAAGLVCSKQTRQAGLITTNSITQTFARSTLDRALSGGKSSLVFAVPDHPWVNSADGAAVRVAMTVLAVGEVPGRLVQVVAEQPIAASDAGEAHVELATSTGIISSAVRIGPQTSSVRSLHANDQLAFRGITLVGDGFLVGDDQFRGSAVVRDFVGAKHLLHGSPARHVVDLFGQTEAEARRNYPAEYQRLFESVRPFRLAQERLNYAESWWVFAEPRPGLRRALTGLRRYIATVETARFRCFFFVEAGCLPEQTLVALALSDAFHFGCLSGRIHLLWTATAGGTLEDRPRYTVTRCFDPFPFPDCSEDQKARIRELGEALDAHRKHQQALHPGLTITGMYNVLEKLRSGEPLSAKDRIIHEQGLVSVLKQIHDDLDAAVAAAYGWPADLSDEEILERLVALNHERAEEEKRGLVRWLRPDFQNPAGVRAATQATLAEAGMTAPEEGAARPAGKKPWPKALPERLRAARELLAGSGRATAADFASQFKGVKAAQAERILESLVAVGVALETREGQGGGRVWRPVR